MKVLNPLNKEARTGGSGLKIILTEEAGWPYQKGQNTL